MAQKKDETVTIGFVVDRQGKEKIKEKGTEALSEVGQVFVKTGTRYIPHPGAEAGGYDVRIWEKATCKIDGEIKPGDLVTHPVDFGIKVTAAKIEEVKKTKPRK